MSVPRVLRGGGDDALGFACDFRAVGGPFRTLTIEFEKAECVRWVCEEY